MSEKSRGPISFELSDDQQKALETISGGRAVRLLAKVSGGRAVVGFVACNEAFTACNQAFTACNKAFTACNEAFNACNAPFSKER